VKQGGPEEALNDYPDRCREDDENIDSPDDWEEYAEGDEEGNNEDEEE
jgi:hypothetical protein